VRGRAWTSAAHRCYVHCVARDDELYALVQEDQRIFFPGGHPGKAQAVQALLGPGYRAIWNDRSGGKRYCGFVTIRHERGEGWHLEYAPADAWRVSTGDAAWALLVDGIDAGALASVDARLLERPATRDDALSLASAPDGMRRAEALVREAFARAAVFGAAACPPIFWRAMPLEVCARTSPVRTGFGALENYVREALRGEWSTHRRRGQAAFAFSRYEDPPPRLKFAAEDYGESLTFDALRERAFVAASGLAFAGIDNPFEPLLRVARDGFLVQEVSPARVVLGTDD
jgi:hypothetical protein